MDDRNQPRPLPVWPLTAAFLGYPLWWALGLGDIMFPVLAAVMTFELIRTRGLRLLVPRGFGLWLGFMVMMTLSVVAIDTFGRFIGFGFRWSLYAAATVIFLYAYHARTSITTRYVAGLMTAFLAIMTIGGFVGLAAPTFRLTTPLAHLLPQSLLSNELVQEMVFRGLTQYNPDAWIPGLPRPSAPFIYTNGWGMAYAVVLPIAIGYLFMVRRGRTFWLALATVVASIVPAIFTQNRGMFIGLGLALLFAIVRLFAQNRNRAAIALSVLALVGVGMLFQAGAAQLVADRLSSSPSTQTRATLYVQTFERTLHSPIIGYGAPRPADSSDLPSLGTQGQVWAVMFSHGFPALAFFLGWFAMALYRARPDRSAVHLAATAGIGSAAVMCAFYNITNATLMIVMLLAALVMRPAPDDA